jgi:DNA-binding NtrC family response regulator
LALCILVVEDDPLVRFAAAQILADAGFETVEAGDANEALDVLENPEREIDVLFTDVRMPGRMNGLVLAKIAQIKRPQLRVIVTSGYYEREELPRGADFLGKPWSASDLISKIRRAAA